MPRRQISPRALVRQETVPGPNATLEEVQACFSDAGQFVRMQVVSPWLSFAGLNGWARTWWIYLLTKVFSRCRLRVDVAFDNDPTFKQTVYIDVDTSRPYSTGVYGRGAYGGTFPDSIFRIQPRQQLSSSLQLTITVLQRDNKIGPAVSFSALSFQWGQARTLTMPRSSETYG